MRYEDLSLKTDVRGWQAGWGRVTGDAQGSCFIYNVVVDGRQLIGDWGEWVHFFSGRLI